MSEEETDDDECFYDMTELLPASLKFSEQNELEKKINEPSSPADEFDENFYQIQEDIQHETIQPYIDEPLTANSFNYASLHLTE
ncbi:unnamed protein product [Rotaria sp. Silwood1]|nr:unnamed protein product [Rotaria sp. Silwood1]